MFTCTPIWFIPKPCLYLRCVCVCVCVSWLIGSSVPVPNFIRKLSLWLSLLLWQCCSVHSTDCRLMIAKRVRSNDCIKPSFGVHAPELYMCPLMHVCMRRRIAEILEHTNFTEHPRASVNSIWNEYNLEPSLGIKRIWIHLCMCVCIHKMAFTIYVHMCVYKYTCSCEREGALFCDVRSCDGFRAQAPMYWMGWELIASWIMYIIIYIYWKIAYEKSPKTCVNIYIYTPNQTWCISDRSHLVL